MVFPLLGPVRKLVNFDRDSTKFCLLSLFFLQSLVSVVDLGILCAVLDYTSFL